MDKKQLIEKLEILNAEAVSSNMVEVTMGMLKKALDALATVNAPAAEDIVDSYHGALHYNNYLSRSEAERFVNRLFQKGLATKWQDAEDLFSKVEAIGGEVEKSPHYNKWALYATMNMKQSDHDKVFTKYAEGDIGKYIELCYDISVSELQDVDRPNYIRPAIGL